MEAFVSVIIPTFNDWDRLRLCLNKLCTQTLSEGSYEIIVVNNNVANPCPYRKDYPNVTFTEELKQGSYAARNKGIKLSKGDILAFTDSDCIPDINWLKNGIAYLDKYDLVGGKINMFLPNNGQHYKYRYNLLNGFNQKYYVEYSNASVTGNLITKQKLFDEIGLFNDDLKSGGDIEWCQRANRNGFSIVYAEDVIVKHPARSINEMVEKVKRVTEGIYYKNSRSDVYLLMREFMRVTLFPAKYLLSKKERYKGPFLFLNSFYFTFVKFIKLMKLYLANKKINE